MPQFCIGLLFCANYTILATHRGGHWAMNSFSHVNFIVRGVFKRGAIGQWPPLNTPLTMKLTWLNELIPEA